MWHLGWRRGVILSMLVLVPACGGPSAPSPIAPSTTSSPPATPPHGTIALLSANPSPGTELTIDSARRTAFTATFSATFDAAVTNAILDLQLLDGGSQACGSGKSEAQNLAAGQAATFSATVTELSCAASATIETLKVQLAGVDLGATFPARYVIRPPAASAVTLTGIVTEPGRGPLSGARIDVEDGANSGKGTTTNAAGRYELNGLLPGTFTLRASKDGYDNSHVRVTATAESATQDFSIGRLVAPSPSPSGAISFVGSDPAPGASVVLTEVAGLVYLRDLAVQLAVRHSEALPDAKLEVQLLGDAGQVCAFTFIDQAVPANQSVTATVNAGWSWEIRTCNSFPVGTATLKTTLLTLRGPEQNGRLQRTDYAVASFPVRYNVQRYPPPPNGPETPPSISEFTWKVSLPVGGDPPIPGDPVAIACTAREGDGAALTISISVTWDGFAPQRYTELFPAGASASPSGARYGIGVVAPNTASPPHARLECLATNDRGQTARSTVDIGRPK